MIAWRVERLTPLRPVSPTVSSAHYAVAGAVQYPALSVSGDDIADRKAASCWRSLPRAVMHSWFSFGWNELKARTGQACR